ncbi:MULTISPECIES: LysR substrate-binding domain-containing protein [Bordetella]|uniref:Transcriptional regulator LrhA n=3 Tax=Bordetella TaxID=517 RepID=A0ABX4FCZ3_9BORD|nr:MULTISPECIES: LysR substrate-binding domain-containing protein [Bordetella]SHR42716.1 HTH-type transcriptional regulator LrhA [Mycobacteroides abscessus subsp. abscessus]AOB26081.1 LysR family transcriptional regulator [Bordetella bronchiseptica]AWP74345.1 transcriptional regulator LrhA [Bordetella bronchiseptica]AZW21144.1 transcriptional regulator LrhA [Bordetella bronchiseptica]KCV31182.1 putative HTH-type transcriptional regulator PecT [Bordetella bronchiseptica 00-P-2796]
MDTLDLDALRTLVVIQEKDGFAAAAVHIGKTQSAVTQQMQRLESQLGRAIFERRGRQKRLTPLGLRLLDYARHLLAVNDEALRSLQQGSLEGVLRIGAPHDVADNMLPPLLAQVARVSPLLQIDIHVGRSPFLMESLHRGEIDMTISNRHDPTLEGVVLRSSPTVWLCSASYLLDSAKPIPLVLADGPSLFRRLAQEALDDAGIRWSPSYTSSSLIGIKAALRAGLGVTARGVELLDAEFRVLGEADGLPRLPDVAYYLFVRKNVVRPLTRRVFDMLKSNMRLLRSSERSFRADLG